MRYIMQSQLKDFMRKNLIAADLFCGCGGFSLGLMMAGINVIAGVDNEPTALNTYQYNLGADDCKWCGNQPSAKWLKKYGKDWKDGSPTKHNHEGSWKRTVKVVICADIVKLSGAQILKYAGVDYIDIIVGSPPCQSFSAANPKGMSRYDEKDELAFEMARIIYELQPKFWILENVPHFRKKKLPDGRLIMDVVGEIASNGYWKKYDHLNLVKDRADLAIKQDQIARNPVEFDYVTAVNLADKVGGRFMVMEGIE